MDFPEIEKLLDPIVALVGGFLSWIGIGGMKMVSKDFVKGREKSLNALLPLAVGSVLKVAGYLPLLAVSWPTLIFSVLGGSVMAGTAHDKVSSPAIKSIKKMADTVSGLFEKKKGKRK